MTATSTLMTLIDRLIDCISNGSRRPRTNQLTSQKWALSLWVGRHRPFLPMAQQKIFLDSKQKPISQLYRSSFCVRGFKWSRYKMSICIEHNVVRKTKPLNSNEFTFMGVKTNSVNSSTRTNYAYFLCIFSSFCFVLFLCNHFKNKTLTHTERESERQTQTTLQQEKSGYRKLSVLAQRQ